jgi:hypothetical protein
VIYDFNNHPFDEERFVESGIPPGRYVIPFSMSEVNLDLFALLPPRLTEVHLRRSFNRFDPGVNLRGLYVQRTWRKKPG